MADKMAATEDNSTASGFKQCVIAIEKKVRNLEKRKGKLDSYRDSALKGQEMNKDQREAIAKYDVVLQNLEFAREILKLLSTMNSEADKQLKKQQKREKIERHQLECSRLREVLLLQNVLNSLGDDSTMREELTSGKVPSLVVNNEQLTALDDFYQLVVPSRENETSIEDQLSGASEHIQCYLDSADKKATATATYKELRDVVERIHASGYLNNQSETPREPTQQIQDTESVDPAVENGNGSMGGADGSDAGVATSRSSSAAADERPTPAESPAHGLREDGMSMTDLQYSHSHQQHWSSSNQSAAISTAAVVQGVKQAADVAAGVGSVPAVSAAALLHTQQQQQQELTAGGSRYSSSSQQFYADSSFPVAGGSARYSSERPINDIVSSLQGASFNFLQDSQIDLDIDPAIVAVLPVSQVASSVGVASAAASGYSYSAVSESRLSSAPNSLHKQQQRAEAHHPSSLFSAQNELYQQQLVHQQQLAQLQQQQIFPGAIQQDQQFSVERSYNMQELRDTALLHQQTGQASGAGRFTEHQSGQTAVAGRFPEHQQSGQASRFSDHQQSNQAAVAGRFPDHQQSSHTVAAGRFPDQQSSSQAAAVAGRFPDPQSQSFHSSDHGGAGGARPPTIHSSSPAPGSGAPFSSYNPAPSSRSADQFLPEHSASVQQKSDQQQQHQAGGGMVRGLMGQTGSSHVDSRTSPQFGSSDINTTTHFRAGGGADGYLEGGEYNGGGDGSRGGGRARNDYGDNGSMNQRGPKMSAGGSTQQYNNGGHPRGGMGGYPNGGGYGGMGGGGGGMRGGNNGGYNRGGARGGSGGSGGGYYGGMSGSQRGAGGGPPRGMAGGSQRGRPPMTQHNQ